MKIRKLLFAMVALCCFFTMAGCGGDSQPEEDYTGTWAQEDVSWINGGIIMDVSRMQDELKIQLVENKPAPDGGGQSVTVKFPEADMKDGFISVEFEGEDYGGYTGTLELQFKGDRVYCEMKDVVYLDEEFSSTALFYDRTTTLIRMDDAHERMECTDEEYDAWYSENFSDEQSREEPAQSSTTSEKSGDEIVAALIRTADFTWDWFYVCAYTDKSDTIVSSQWTEGWTYEKVNYPGISSLQDIRALTRQYYTADVAEETIALKDWIEQNGALYVSATEGLGGGIEPCRIEVSVTRDSDTCYTLTLYNIYDPELSDENGSYNVHYQYVNGYWVFDSFLYISDYSEVKLVT